MKQDIETIRNLLSKYYDGTSSAEEENTLHEYFRTADIHEEFDADRRLFISLDTEAKAPEWLKEKIERRLIHRGTGISGVHRWIVTITAAATFALAITAGFSLFRTPVRPQNSMSPEEIRRITAMALNKLATTVEKGCNAVESAETRTIETTQIAIKSINSI